MGPYSTRAQAQQALASAKARNESWEKDDEDWQRAADAVVLSARLCSNERSSSGNEESLTSET